MKFVHLIGISNIDFDMSAHLYPRFSLKRPLSTMVNSENYEYDAQIPIFIILFLSVDGRARRAFTVSSSWKTGCILNWKSSDDMV